MPEWREIPIRDLPSELTREVHQKIRFHGVTMVAARADGGEPVCCSGTFTTINGIAGILTARHVWEIIERAPTLALLVGGRPYYLDPRILRAFGPGYDDTLAEVAARVPDIAFVHIPPEACGAIEAYGKVFYSIDRRRRDPEMAFFSDRGFWILAGSPQALFGAATGMAPSFLYDTFVDRHVEAGAWDYLFVNLNLDQNPEIPRTYGGMSGGGIWRAAFSLSEDQTVFAVENPQRDIVLSGVAFYQTGPEGRQIIGHGPKSLYATLPGLCVDEVT